MGNALRKPAVTKKPEQNNVVRSLPKRAEPVAKPAGNPEQKVASTPLDLLADFAQDNASLIDKYRAMLDYVPQNILLADLNFNIVYMNKSSYTTLNQIAHLLPVPVDKIIGGSMDVFHKKPTHQRHIVGNDRNLPHNAKIKLGEHILHLNVCAVCKRWNLYGPNGDLVDYY